jgi:D-aminoacyl-tRNA deacylase
MYAIVISADPAGENIKGRLIEKGFTKTPELFRGKQVYQNGKMKLFTSQLRCINNESIDEEISAEIIVFATTHRSAAGTNSLSVHAPGNWDKAELGGQPGKLCIAPALFIKKAFSILSQIGAGTGYEITLEVTHHGPYLKSTPCMFIEIGSTEEQWEDKKAGGIIADTLINTFSEGLPKAKSCIGLGGSHYAPYFNKVQLMEGYAVGHICPKYAMQSINPELLKQAIEKTQPKAELALLDWKGLGTNKQGLMRMLNQLNIPSKRCRKL